MAQQQQQPWSETRVKPTLKWSWKIGSLASISIYMHWTFLILVAWIAFIHYRQSGEVAVALQGILLVLAIFACVVLHELGHALTARRYGIRTRDITLLPIGGIASLERMPEEPKQELAIAIAGPLVNVAIAVVLFLLILIASNFVGPEQILSTRASFLPQLMWINLILVVFNLVPAFPMDGGRVLRAMLATRMDYAKATNIAAGVGQALAIAFGFFGFFSGNWILLFIALFVYLGAEGESQAVMLRTTFRNVPVRDAMMTRFRALDSNESLQVAIDELLAGSQQDFPVVSNDEVVGVLPRMDLLKALASGKRDGTVGEVMHPEFVAVEGYFPLDKAYERMREAGTSTAPVLQDGRLVGMLTLENISEWAMIRSALGEINAPPRIARMVGA